jgi:hypothetical protein
MSKSVVLIDKINFEPYAEDRPAEHPLAGLTITEVKELITEWEKEFRGYENLYLKVKQNWVGYGGLHSEWYQLVGTPTPLAKAMNEPSEF